MYISISLASHITVGMDTVSLFTVTVDCVLYNKPQQLQIVHYVYNILYTPRHNTLE